MITYPANLKHEKLRNWVDEMVALCKPEKFIGATAPRKSTTSCAKLSSKPAHLSG